MPAARRRGMFSSAPRRFRLSNAVISQSGCRSARPTPRFAPTNPLPPVMRIRCGTSAYGSAIAMSEGTQAQPRRPMLLAWGGGVLALAVGALLFSRFGIHGNLFRDESIYAYGGQQLADGVPAYLGIFDPKPPLPTFLDALGVVGGRALGKDGILTMRAEYFAFALLAVVAVYVLGLQLWKSPLAALAGAVTFASFKGFAIDALGGPDAKTPGILLVVVCLALLVRRRWFLSALSGSLAFLDWQPLGVYAAAAVVAAVFANDDEARWKRGARAVAGAVVPLVATILFLAIDGGLSQFFDASFWFPLTGLHRGHVTLGGNVDTIVGVVNQHYGDTRVLFWAGLAVLAAVLAAWLVRRRSVLAASVVLGTLLAVALLSIADFQGYPDLYPLLPYAAIGIGAAVAVAAPRIHGLWPRRIAGGLALVAVAALAALSAHWYSTSRDSGPSLPAERAAALKVRGALDPGEQLYALGDPTPLVLARVRNPTRWIYLGSGVDRWAIHREFRSLAGWQAEIRRVDPPIVVMNLWRSPTGQSMRRWLERTYGHETHLVHWTIFAKPAIRPRAARRGIRLCRSCSAPTSG